jgi:hypothetical protein
MPRRIEIELTSAREDGSWTWRAAGAKAPKGTVEASILPPAAKVGDVLRAEADFFVDGIQVTSIVPPKAARQEPERIELIAPSKPDEPLVTTTLAPRARAATARAATAPAETAAVRVRAAGVAGVVPTAGGLRVLAPREVTRRAPPQAEGVVHLAAR